MAVDEETPVFPHRLLVADAVCELPGHSGEVATDCGFTAAECGVVGANGGRRRERRERPRCRLRHTSALRSPSQRSTAATTAFRHTWTNYINNVARTEIDFPAVHARRAA
jgi:hypothetical protein